MTPPDDDVPTTVEPLGEGFHDLLDGNQFHDLQQAVFPVIGRQGSVAKLRGTAFGISSDLALTASHVADDWNILDEMAILHSATNPDGTIERTIVPVLEATSHGVVTDVAVLRLALPMAEERPLRIGALRIGFAPPEIGEHCVTVGYTLADSSGIALQMSDTESVARMQPSFFSSSGPVVDLYPDGMSLCRFPCFHVDGEVRSQMSGGPVLFAEPDGKMAVRGLISSGSDPEAVGGPFYFPSMLYPAAALEPGAPYGVQQSAAREFLLDLALSGRVRSVDASVVDLDVTDPDRPRVGLK